MSRTATAAVPRPVTLTTTDPARLRLRVVERVASMAEADDAGIMSVREVDGTTLARMDAATPTIAARVAPLLSELRHGPGFAGLYRARCRDPRAGREFLDPCLLLGRAAYEAGFPYPQLISPAGYDHHARLLAQHGDRLIGNLIAFRRRGEKPIPIADRKRLTRHARAFTDALVAADALEARTVPDAPGTILLDLTGAVQAADEVGRAWLAVAGFAEALRHAARCIDRRELAVVPLPASAHARIVRLGGEGKSMLLAIVARSPALRLPRDRVLTATQRRVAVAAAAGATNAEIARELSMAHETARAHLKEVYRRLQVRCRVGLVRALEEG